MELKVEKILQEKGIPYRLLELSAPARTVDDVTKYSKVPVEAGEICKTVIIKLKAGGYAGAVLRGNQRLDNRKAQALFGKKFRFARPEEVPLAANAEPGAVCPLLLDIPLYIDPQVFETEKVNFGSGDLMYGLEMNSEDLEKVLDFEIVELV